MLAPQSIVLTLKSSVFAMSVDFRRFNHSNMVMPKTVFDTFRRARRLVAVLTVGALVAGGALVAATPAPVLALPDTSQSTEVAVEQTQINTQSSVGLNGLVTTGVPRVLLRLAGSVILGAGTKDHRPRQPQQHPRHSCYSTGRSRRKPHVCATQHWCRQLLG